MLAKVVNSDMCKSCGQLIFGLKRPDFFLLLGICRKSEEMPSKAEVAVVEVSQFPTAQISHIHKLAKEAFG